MAELLAAEASRNRARRLGLSFLNFGGVPVMWTNLADKPDTLEIEEMIAHVQNLRHRMVDRLRSTRGRGTQVFLERLLRRIHRVDDLAAIENWLRAWRDTLQEIPGRAWQSLA